MTKTYFKICDYCKEKIEMSDKEGKWLPYNLNNGPHDCRNNGKEITLVQAQQNNNDITLEVVLKKLESIGITIDLTKLRNVKQ